jgi:hypothetical protein
MLLIDGSGRLKAASYTQHGRKACSVQRLGITSIRLPEKIIFAAII